MDGKERFPPLLEKALYTPNGLRNRQSLGLHSRELRPEFDHVMNEVSRAAQRARTATGVPQAPCLRVRPLSVPFD